MNAKREEEKRAEEGKTDRQGGPAPAACAAPNEDRIRCGRTVRARRVPEPLYTTSAQFNPDVFRPAKPRLASFRRTSRRWRWTRTSDRRGVATAPDPKISTGSATRSLLNWRSARNIVRSLRRLPKKRRASGSAGEKSSGSDAAALFIMPPCRSTAVDRLHPSSGPARHRADQAEVARGDADDR